METKIIKSELEPIFYTATRNSKGSDIEWIIDKSIIPIFGLDPYSLFLRNLNRKTYVAN